MTPGQTLAATTARILAALDPILAAEPWDLVVVQGDTTTTMAGSLAAFYRGIPVAHVEAGLRTGDLARPFPEELNRLVTGRLAALHFAPTDGARCNLLAEGVPAGRIFVTGNSGIDAVLDVAGALGQGRLPALVALAQRPQADRRHRAPPRELRRRDRAHLRGAGELARRPDVQIAYPVHRNPRVLGPVPNAWAAFRISSCSTRSTTSRSWI